MGKPFFRWRLKSIALYELFPSVGFVHVLCSAASDVTQALYNQSIKRVYCSDLAVLASGFDFRRASHWLPDIEAVWGAAFVSCLFIRLPASCGSYQQNPSYHDACLLQTDVALRSLATTCLEGTRIELYYLETNDFELMSC